MGSLLAAGCEGLCRSKDTTCLRFELQSEQEIDNEPRHWGWVIAVSLGSFTTRSAPLRDRGSFTGRFVHFQLL